MRGTIPTQHQHDVGFDDINVKQTVVPQAPVTKFVIIRVSLALAQMWFNSITEWVSILCCYCYIHRQQHGYLDRLEYTFSYVHRRRIYITTLALDHIVIVTTIERIPRMSTSRDIFVGVIPRTRHFGTFLHYSGSVLGHHYHSTTFNYHRCQYYKKN